MSKILLYDIETLPIIATTFSLYPESINHDNILNDWSIISVAWKLLDKKTIYSSSILDDPKAFKKDVNNDYVVVKKFRDILEDVDILIGHNSKKFDTKKFNARLIFHGLPPLPSGILQLDTLTEIKRVAAFSSHRLDYLGKHLTGEGKKETSKGLWLRVLKGEKKAVEEMVSYNKQDVQVLEDVYLKIKPYIKHPHVGAIEGWDKDNTCPRCANDEFLSSKVRYTAAGVKRVQKQCKKCYSYTTFSYKATDK